MKPKRTEITSDDLKSSATLSDLPSLLDVLKLLESSTLSRLLDLGCGYGGLTMFLANRLGIDDVYGVDINEERLSQARARGIITHKIDLEKEKLPFPCDFFDIVTCFGSLEHLSYFDNFFSESFRVLRKGGYLLISMPNLGSYVNRIGLLLGFQPRDVEILRREPAQGFLPGNVRQWLGHVHSATLRAMKYAIGSYGFTIVKVRGSSPHTVPARLVRVLDKIFGTHAGLSRRFIILSQKPGL